MVDTGLCPQPLALLEAVLAAGVKLVQYRAKAGVERELVRAMRARTQAAQAFLIVNDDLEAALEADGLHMGQEDLAEFGPSPLRDRLGGRILGLSCGTVAEAREASALGVDYLGVGPFGPTATKADAGEPLGFEGLRAIVAAATVPVAAIGGICLEDLDAVVRSGAAMAAVASAIARAPDPRAQTQRFVARWEELKR